jgi:hypothetical protein
MIYPEVNFIQNRIVPSNSNAKETIITFETVPCVKRPTKIRMIAEAESIEARIHPARKGATSA